MGGGWVDARGLRLKGLGWFRAEGLRRFWAEGALGFRV